MKNPIPTTLTAVAAALAAVTVAGCTAAPSPTLPTPPAAFSTLPAAPGSAVQEYTRQSLLDKLAAMEANAAIGLLGGVDRGLATAAAKDGVPLVFAQDDRSDACGRWLRLPDRSLWSLSTGGALTRDTNLETTLAKWKGGVPAYACHPGTDTAVPPFDAAIADAAARDGKPYRWRDHDACFDSLRIPGSAATFTVPDKVSDRGDALTAQVSLIGCRVAPTAPKGN